MSDLVSLDPGYYADISVRGHEMQMIPVRSSAITAVGYDPITKKMKITFKQGRTYDFCGVPPEVYRGLVNAGSKGGYYDLVIRDRYQC